MKLFMVLLGSKPKGRHTEQHDVYFGIGENMKSLIPQFEIFWPEAIGNMHVDGWLEVSLLKGFTIEVNEKADVKPSESDFKLFFINLGGYKAEIFEEFHFKVLVVSQTKAEAIQIAKHTEFFKHTGFEAAPSHIDDRYGIDVDEIYEIDELLSPDLKAKYSIKVTPTDYVFANPIHLGYFKLDKL